MANEAVLNKLYGVCVLKVHRTGWCTPVPAWCNDHLAFARVKNQRFLTNHATYSRWLNATRKLFPDDLDWIKEIYSWSPRCVNLRPSNGLSLHAWGLAIDINWTENPYGQPNQTIPEQFIECMTDNGFTWGGHWRIPDPHHFELNVFP